MSIMHRCWLWAGLLALCAASHAALPPPPPEPWACVTPAGVDAPGPVRLRDAKDQPLSDSAARGVAVLLTFSKADLPPAVEVEWLAGEPPEGGSTPWLDALIAHVQAQRMPCVAAAGGGKPVKVGRIYTHAPNPEGVTLASRLRLINTPDARAALLPGDCLPPFFAWGLVYPQRAWELAIDGYVRIDYMVTPGSGVVQILGASGPAILVEAIQKQVAGTVARCRPSWPLVDRFEFVFKIPNGEFSSNGDQARELERAAAAKKIQTRDTEQDRLGAFTVGSDVQAASSWMEAQLAGQAPWLSAQQLGCGKAPHAPWAYRTMMDSRIRIRPGQPGVPDGIPHAMEFDLLRSPLVDWLAELEPPNAAPIAGEVSKSAGWDFSPCKTLGIANASPAAAALRPDGVTKPTPQPGAGSASAAQAGRQ